MIKKIKNKIFGDLSVVNDKNKGMKLWCVVMKSRNKKFEKNEYTPVIYWLN